MKTIQYRSMSNILGWSWKPVSLTIGIVMSCSLFINGSVFASDPPQRPIDFNVIEGFAKNKLLRLTYPIQYMCVHDAFRDLDHDGTVAVFESERVNFQSKLNVM